MNRRRFVVRAAAGGAGLVAAGLSTPVALATAPATDDELAFANFGLATELLLEDFYAKAIAAKLFGGAAAHDLARGGFNAGEHATALAKLITDAGQTAAVAEDFEFTWPAGTFATRRSAAAAGSKVVEALLGVYVSAGSVISIPSYRMLFGSMATNIAQQAAVLSQGSGGRAVGVSFPPALDIETASDRIEAYLG